MLLSRSSPALSQASPLADRLLIGLALTLSLALLALGLLGPLLALLA